MSWWETGAFLSLMLALLALLLLALAPLGWRAGWWHFRFAFAWLMTASGVAALAAVIVALAVLLLSWSQLGAGRLTMAAIGLVLGAVLVYVPWHYDRARKTVPRIHDITTDVENPPQFLAVLPARSAEDAATAVYAGPELARLQRAAYPDVVALELALPAAKAFDLALSVARSLSGWNIIASDPASGRIEASQTSRWFGFTDDIVIRVMGHGSGSQVDMRSLSRQGRSDFGVNAARIRLFMAALRKRLG
ncbi:MAG TPA: DUF1499 domain-containing protein [Hyphomicrobiaceae bacterium]|nr:DUF1499 domain-containing protein [Hyphomicrobiaceae bacterium]